MERKEKDTERKERKKEVKKNMAPLAFAIDILVLLSHSTEHEREKSFGRSITKL